ncbi:hypothetical protein ACWEOI_07105 [Nocardia sp. NPDC004340]
MVDVDVVLGVAVFLGHDQGAAEAVLDTQGDIVIGASQGESVVGSGAVEVGGLGEAGVDDADGGAAPSG